ncbi:hypothetical protein [Kiloniella sp. b19]|uniref:hypothetical protein n=1 Tax=Kiloniella sp. GXU_MW_B19 TaxID=3141326 RepID=UPI0031E01F07
MSEKERAPLQKPGEKKGPNGKSSQEERMERQAQALRANLKRRKSQMRERMDKE